MEWKSHDTDYKYAYGTMLTSLRALDLMFKLFLFLHVTLIAALGAQWLEGLKIFGVNFCLLICICFFYLGTFQMVGKKVCLPITIWFSAACGIAYTLNSV